MRSSKFSMLVVAVLTLSLAAFAHETSTSMHTSTKSPQAHAYFETGLQKMEMLHIQDALDNFRNAVKADPQFALGHIFLTFFSEDPTEQVAERDKALANREFANPEEKQIIDWLGASKQSRLLPAIQNMNEVLQKNPQDKHLYWLSGWGALGGPKQSRSAPV